MKRIVLGAAIILAASASLAFAAAPEAMAEAVKCCCEKMAEACKCCD